MNAYGVKLYGVMDLRLEPFETGEMRQDEILVQVVCNSLCMSDYKIACLGENHKKIPKDIKTNPIIIGHEMGCKILAVGGKWKEQYTAGQHVCVQPNLDLPGSSSIPGYTYTRFGGCTDYCVVPEEVIRAGCLIPFEGPYFVGSLAEPVSCIVGAFNSCFHLPAPHVYEHQMGTKRRGNMAILAGCGPMGLGMVDYALHSDNPPAVLCVTDADDERIQKARGLFSEDEAAKHGVKLRFFNRPRTDALLQCAPEGFDDVFVLNAIEPLLEQAGGLLATDGCLNFFAGPTDKNFSARFNFYNVHYRQAHVVGTSGASIQDMKETLLLGGQGKLHPQNMVTHIGGLNCAAEAIKILPELGGGKKLIYNSFSMPLVAIEDFESYGKENPFFEQLGDICKAHNNMWCKEAEDVLLSSVLKNG